MKDENKSKETLINELVKSRQKIARLEFLAGVSRTLSSTLDLNTILSTVARLCGQAIDASSVYVGTNDFEAGTTTVLAEYFAPSASDKERESDLGVTYSIEDNFPMFIEWLKKPTEYFTIQVDNPEHDAMERRHLDEYGAKSSLVIRFTAGDDFGGYIELWESRDKREFREDEIELILSVAQQLSLILKNAHLYKDLEASKDRYRVISELVADYAYRYIIEEDGKWKRAWTTEEAFKRLTGYERDELAGTYDLYHPEEQERVKQDVQLTLQGQATESEYRIITKSGELRWIDLHRQPEWDETGQFVIGFYGSAKDITARKEAEKQVIELRVQNERIQLLEELVSDLSHDIKTPLFNIKNFLYLLQTQSNPDKQAHYLNRMDAQIQRLNQLIEDILTMSRLDKGAELVFVPLSANDLLEDIRSANHGLIEKKEIKLDFDLNLTLPSISGNKTELTRALTNLIMNAVHYTPAGNSIIVRTYLQGETVTIEISDTGIGISKNDLPNIFDRFFRADKVRNTHQGGTGLGLAIVKKIIDLHDGKIEVSSVLEEGSIFSVQLPI